MFLAMGVGAYAAGIFHLYTHAFFKALLFLGSGAVIHALAGEQDLRNMGGLKKHLPITYWTFLIGALAIAGVPLLSGFFSKDEILFRTFIGEQTPGHRVMWTLGVLTSLLTATYMFRLVFLAFHGERRVAPSGAHHAVESDVTPAAHGHAPAHGHATAHGHGAHGHGLHDAPPTMAVPLIVLALGSILAGYVGVPHALGGSNRIEQFLEPSFETHAASTHDSTAATAAAEPGVQAVSTQHTETSADEHLERTELMLMGISSGVAIAGILIAVYFWLRNPAAAAAMASRLRPIYTLLYNKYYVDELYDTLLVQPIKQLSIKGLWRGADAILIDGAVNGVGTVVNTTSTALRRLQTGSVRTYATAIFVGVVLMLGYYLVR
jgi:NADH-quinone oxidoreductase subunit L